MIPTPEGHKTESFTLQSAHEIHAMIVNPKVNETESPFYDASKTPAKSSAIMVAPEKKETESTPVQGMEPGVQGTSALHSYYAFSLMTQFSRSNISFKQTRGQAGTPGIRAA